MSGRGLPSWYKYRAYGPVYEEIRLAEHAVRLGSPVSFDRRGDVIFIDNFEHGLEKWTTWAVGTGAAVKPSVRTYRSGGISAKLTAGTTGLMFARIQNGCIFTADTKYGFEFSFIGTEDTPYIELWLDIRAKVNRYYAGIRYRFPEQDIQYLNSSNVWTTLQSGIWITSLIYVFHTMKLCVDPATGKYLRLLLDHRSILMDQDMRLWGTTAEPGFIIVQIEHKGISAANLSAYIDDVIVTQNEP